MECFINKRFLRRWYADKCLETSFPERKEKSLFVFVNFCGVNTLSMVAFKLPMISLISELGSRAGTSSGNTPLRSIGISVCTSDLLYVTLQRNLLNSTTYLTTFFPPNSRHYVVLWKIGDKIVSDAPSIYFLPNQVFYTIPKHLPSLWIYFIFSLLFIL